ncbi:M15 family metallopeptidase [Mycolicibacterium septicum]|uniref:M15 family metallopeptidase n=1 Tax=Mycolicibacterium septicum TaxID=98668 RepID=UPI001AF3D388|nr:M15 family metallopeptidase [Mycolicibacterium septicum]QRY51721.1 M15 family metallopeptidase [Mycolicibacterium septicum]
MANRIVYGLTHSSNGWPMVDEGSCTWVKIPGTSVTLQIQNGQPLAILRAFAADFNAYVEPLRDADSACWTPTNSVSSSNHLSGTAMDLNWGDHPFYSNYGGYTPAEIATVRELLDFYEGFMFWGQDWTNPKDCMHFQLSSLANGGPVNTYGNPAVDNFIARKIRADGFSTFRRGNAPVGGAPVLAAATGLSEARAAEILPAVQSGLRQSDATTVPRIAQWLAQVGHESVSFYYTEEIAKNGRYAPYIGRTWIQITWDYNYRAFSEWCFDRGLVPTRDYFVVNYQRLADLEWAGLGASWYWTEQRPMNALVDAGENASWNGYRGFSAVTAAINGGTNGLADRQARYNRALALGDRLLTLIDSDSGDDLASVPQDQWDRVFREQTQKLPSRSALRRLGEGVIDTWAGIDLNQDGNLHVLLVKTLAELGDTDSLDLLREVASADPVRYPDRQKDRQLALRILADIEANKPGVLQNYLAEKGIA